MMTLMQLKRDSVETGTITDAQYDWGGKRLATTSTDATITIRDLDSRGGWIIKDGGEIKAAHAGVIWRVSWAHPHFGQTLATCCQDGTVKIWEEVEGHLRNGKRWPTRWYAQTTIAIDKVVSDVKFAPRHQGLKIATALGDGSIRIYGSTGGNQWSAQEVFGDREGSISCLSWMPSRFELPMMVVGTSTGRVQIWRNRPTMKLWNKILELPGHHSLPVTDVDWATCTGRKHHRVASCGVDGKLQVHLLTRVRGGEDEDGRRWKAESHNLQDHEQDVRTPLKENPEPRNKTGASDLNATRRVVWDAMGAVLNSRVEDGTLRMWRRDADGDWVCVDSLRADSVEGGTEETDRGSPTMNGDPTENEA